VKYIIPKLCGGYAAIGCNGGMISTGAAASFNSIVCQRGSSTGLFAGLLPQAPAFSLLSNPLAPPYRLCNHPLDTG
jgi:hypothetical protein